MNSDIRKKLEIASENKNAEFCSSIVPGAKNILGIKIPVLRAYAKEIVRDLGESALDESNDVYYEEKMLRGMIIGYLKADAQKILEYTRAFVPLIDNWAVCDSFCSTLKFTIKNRELVWEFLQQYVNSDKKFENRFTAVMMLDYYVTADYITKTLEALKKVNTNKYYSSMAVAWAMAECFIKFPDETKPYISQKFFDAETHNRTIRKICDSYRVKPAEKEKMKLLLIK